MAQASERVFLFLQGPHGPFYARLSEALVRRGARVRRAAFNRADAAEWPGRAAVDFWDGTGVYRDWIRRLIRRSGATDVVVYGDTRPIHAEALEVSGDLGLIAHRFEEGYLRPFWITYERDGTNGASPARFVPLAAMSRSVAALPERAGSRTAPAGWGATRQHLAWSALYHARVLLGGTNGTRYRGHRALPLGREALLYARRLAGMGVRPLQRAMLNRRIERAAAPYHVVLLQLSFDCSMAAHGPFDCNADLLRRVIRGFAEGAPPHHRLIFRTHPFEDGREALTSLVRSISRKEGTEGRVHLVEGASGLAALLDGAASAITVNSTAGHQALSRGLPLLALGDAVYSRPGLAQDGDIAAFFEEPAPPDPCHYGVFRRFLQETSQIQGSFYSAAGIAEAISALPDIMLDRTCPYQKLLGTAQEKPRLSLVGPAPAGSADELAVLCS